MHAIRGLLASPGHQPRQADSCPLGRLSRCRPRIESTRSRRLPHLTQNHAARPLLARPDSPDGDPPQHGLERHYTSLWLGPPAQGSQRSPASAYGLRHRLGRDCLQLGLRYTACTATRSLPLGLPCLPALWRSATDPPIQPQPHTAQSLRGICWSTKTSRTGQPFAVTLTGLSGRCTASSWCLNYLLCLHRCWLATEAFWHSELEPDFLLPILPNWASKTTTALNPKP